MKLGPPVVSLRAMLKRIFVMLTLAALATSCSTPAVKSAAEPISVTATSLVGIQRAGTKFKNVLRLPEFETTPAAIQATADQTMASANAALDQIGKLPHHRWPSVEVARHTNAGHRLHSD